MAFHHHSLKGLRLITEHDIRREHDAAVASLSGAQRRAFERELMCESSSWREIGESPALKTAFRIEAAMRNARPCNDNDFIVI